MSEFIEVKTVDLIGPALDWAVGSALDLPVYVFDQEVPYAYVILPEYLGTGFRPSTDWSQGGPLIEKHQIELVWDGVDGVAMWWKAEHQDIADFQLGDTPLIAACRAIVGAKLGEVVSVPKELMS